MDTASQPGRHKCLIYDGDPSEQLHVVVPLLSEALRENRRCLYLGPPAMLAAVETALSQAGVDVAGQARRRALILSADRSHLDGGRFRPQAMVEGLRRMVEEALRDGFTGLCATGDMRWEIGSDENLDGLVEYEARLERAFQDLPLSGVCQYHRGSLPDRVIRDALMTHRSVYLADGFAADNLFFVPPELLVEDPGPAVRDRQGRWMYEQLSRIMKAEAERDKARAALAELARDLEERVRERTAQLRAANKELEMFNFSVSHDLRAPLRAIDGFTAAILRRHGGALPPDARENFERVRAAAARMGQLIDGLLDLSRFGRAEPRRETVDLSDCARRALEELRAAEPGRRPVEIIVEPGLSAWGDPRLLAAALMNLLANAWKFTSKTPRARVEFGCLRGGGGRAFFVRDNGAGFDMAYADKLFRPFWRLHSSSEFPGNGVGLATAERIICRHGGRIWAESSPGAGASFYFTLPG